MKTLVATLLAFVMLAAHAEPRIIYVSPNGLDTNHGDTVDALEDNKGPFQTLHRAVESLNEDSRSEGAIIRILPGTYTLDTTLSLDAATSGTEAAPIIIEGVGPDPIRLMAGRFIEGFTSLTDETILGQIDPAARDHVLVTDLKAQGITEYGNANGRGLELFFNGDPMQIARWPNEGFTKIVEEAGGEKFKVHGQPGDKIGIWVYDGDRPSRWVNEKDPWLNGYWFWDWSSQYQSIDVIDTEAKTIKVKEPYHNYGYRKGQWYYALNMLSEIDMPGEWYLDREAGMLYFWPPSDIDTAEVYVSQLGNAIVLDNASHVTLKNLIIEGARSTVIRGTGGESNRVIACTVRNSGSTGIYLSGGTDHQVIGCDVYEVGASGIVLQGGQRETLTPANHLAENNHIHHYARWDRMYRPGIGISGVGIKIRHNLIDNAPHMAIQFGGNDHLMEYNEIHSVCYESNDAGAIYSGRDWTQRGTVIRYNYMHHVTGFEDRGCVGVYLDDMFCGTHIHGNLFYKVHRAAFIGGGRDITYENNLFVDCPKALHIDARALGWAASTVPTTMMDRLKAMPYESDVWKERYPRLPNILNEEYAAPEGNLIARNILIGDNWNDINKVAAPYIELKDNITDTDLDINNRDEVTAQKTPRATDFEVVMPQGFEFKPLPKEKMGLYESDNRASWPVEHEVK